MPSTTVGGVETPVGRFISRDPIRYRAGDINLYRFVGNNPYGRVDPFGLTPRGFDSTNELKAYCSKIGVAGETEGCASSDFNISYSIVQLDTNPDSGEGCNDCFQINVTKNPLTRNSAFLNEGAKLNYEGVEYVISADVSGKIKKHEEKHLDIDEKLYDDIFSRFVFSMNGCQKCGPNAFSILNKHFQTESKKAKAIWELGHKDGENGLDATEGLTFDGQFQGDWDLNKWWRLSNFTYEGVKCP